MTDAAGSAAAQALFRLAKDHLARAGIPAPDLDASLLMEHATGLTALDRMTDPDRPVDCARAEGLKRLVARRLAGEPVHRILGQREFYGLTLALNEATLIPRPDTETLVDLALPFVREAISRKGECRVLDLGAGTGAIALALLANAPGSTATGVDISAKALEAARENATRHGLSERFQAHRSDWFSDVIGKYDLVVSNPPYIRTREIPNLDIEVRDHDPRIALDGGADGLKAYAVIAAQSVPFLAEKGAIAIEIGHDQKQEVSHLFRSQGYRKISERKDFSGRDRALIFGK